MFMLRVWLCRAALCLGALAGWGLPASGQSAAPPAVPAATPPAVENTAPPLSPPQNPAAAAPNPAATPSPTEPVEPAEAPEETSGDRLQLVSPEEIQQRLASLESATLDEAEKRKATEFFQKALAALTVLDQQRAATEHYKNLLASYGADLKNYQTKLAALPPQVAAVDDDKSISELELEVSAREQELKQLREALDDSNSKLKKRSDGLANFPKLAAEKQQELDSVKQQLDKVQAAENSDVVSSAELIYLKAQEQALVESLQAIELNRQYYAESEDLAQIRRDFRAKKLAQDEKYLTALREVVNQSRLAQANQQASAAASAAAVQRPESVAKLATDNAELAQDQADVASRIAELDAMLAATQVNWTKSARPKPARSNGCRRPASPRREASNSASSRNCCPTTTAFPARSPAARPRDPTRSTPSTDCSTNATPSKMPTSRNGWPRSSPRSPSTNGLPPSKKFAPCWNRNAKSSTPRSTTTPSTSRS